MAKSEKLSKAQVKQLSAIGITKAKDVEDARQQMITFLHSESIEDVEEDSFEELYEMASLMYDGSDAENNDLAEEVEDEDLEAQIEAEVEDADEEDEEEDEDDEEEEVEVKSKKKVKAPKAKATKAKVEKAVKRITKRLDPKNNPEDAKRYDALVNAVQALSPDDKFDFNFIANGGVTVKFLGENSKRAFFSFDSPKSKGDQIFARVYFPVLKKEDDVRDLFGEDYEIKADWSGNHLVHDVDVNDLVTLMTNEDAKFQAILTSLGKKDEKLGKNRKKMIDDLSASKKDKVEKIQSKKSGKAKQEEAVEEVAEVEETVEEVKPKKKATKKATTKKADTTTKTVTKKKPSKKKAAASKK